MSSPQVSHEIHTLLRRLRRRIRSYVLMDGLAVLVVWLGFAFWLSFGLDVAWFHWNRLELPRWFRVGFDVVVFSSSVVMTLRLIGFRMLRRFRSRALALLLEERFPKLDDRLITAVEMSESGVTEEAPLTAAMLQRTIDEVAKAASCLDLSDVFDQHRLRRVSLAATALAASIVAIAFASPESLRRWNRGFLTLEHEYWQREFGLTLKVVTQRGDRVKDFKDRGAAFDHKHARGDDLILLAEVNRTGKVPELVELYYRLRNSQNRSRVLCSRVDDYHFRHDFGPVFGDLDLWVVGGDYMNRKPYHVTLVDAPRVDRIVMDCAYPEYMGRDVSSPVKDDANAVRDRVPVLGRQVSLPVETEFVLRAECNKPLVGVRIEFKPYELALRIQDLSASNSVGDEGHNAPAASETAIGLRVTATLSCFSEDGTVQSATDVPAAAAARFFAEDRQGFHLPFVLSPEAADAARSRIRSLRSPYGPCFVLRPDTAIRMTLEDLDEIVGSEPAVFTLNGIADEPPRVETELRGIGSSITSKAVIPVTGKIEDDYGVTEVRFEYLIDGENAWVTQPFHSPPKGITREFQIGESENDDVERFAVTPLELAVGKKITLTVAAEDGDNLNGPHTGHGAKYTFQIVTNEELLSLLYQRELNLRQRFEQAIGELKQTQHDLEEHQATLKTRATESPRNGETPTPELATTVERSLQTIRKDANESAEIELAFRDIREEMLNNAVQTEQMLERIDDRILSPLQSVNTHSYPQADSSLGLLRLTLDKQGDPSQNLAQSIDAIASLVAHMEDVLQEMRRLETFQEVLETLKAIIRDQEGLTEETKSEQKRKLLDKLKDLGLE